MREGMFPNELLYSLGKDNRNHIATKLAIRELKSIWKMEQGDERDKMIGELLADLIELDNM